MSYFQVGDLVRFNPRGEWRSYKDNIGIVYAASNKNSIFTYVYWLIDDRAKPRGNGGFYHANLEKVETKS